MGAWVSTILGCKVAFKWGREGADEAAFLDKPNPGAYLTRNILTVDAAQVQGLWNGIHFNS
jgi:hypothetical protein